MTMRLVLGAFWAAEGMESVPLIATWIEWLSYWSGVKPSPLIIGEAM